MTDAYELWIEEEEFYPEEYPFDRELTTDEYEMLYYADNARQMRKKAIFDAYKATGGFEEEATRKFICESEIYNDYRFVRTIVAPRPEKASREFGMFFLRGEINPVLLLDRVEEIVGISNTRSLHFFQFAAAVLVDEVRKAGLMPSPDAVSLIICSPEIRDKIAERLRELIRGKKGVRVACVVAAARELKIIAEITFSELQKYFGADGTQQGYNEAINKIEYQPEKYSKKIAPFVEELKAVMQG